MKNGENYQAIIEYLLGMDGLIEKISSKIMVKKDAFNVKDYFDIQGVFLIHHISKFKLGKRKQEFLPI